VLIFMLLDYLIMDPGWLQQLLYALMLLTAHGTVEAFDFIGK